MFVLIVFLLTVTTVPLTAGLNEDLQNLAAEYWQWRFMTQPSTGDDILRIDRPAGWTPDFSPAALESQRQKYKRFSDRLKKLPKSNWAKQDSVDYLLLFSAIERINWELNVLRNPHRNPDFYVHQTLGAVFELLLIHTPVTRERIDEIIIRLRSFPATLNHAKENLDSPVAPFARIAIDNLEGISDKLVETAQALKHITDKDQHAALDVATNDGIAALESYRHWLMDSLPGMSEEFSIGRDAYVYFLKNIALIPYSPEELLLQGRLEWQRAVAFETFEKQRNKDLSPPALFATAQEQITQQGRDEQAVRQFLEDQDIMTVPAWLRHYLNKTQADYFTPLSFMGVGDDLTSEERLDENAVRYIRDPDPSLPYFHRSMAIDPRPIIVHEGIPGHYYQLARSWRNPDPIRRRFVDSGPIEGIGLYVEEMLLQFGLFDDRPYSREIIYNYMRLRALRVEVDVSLALGNFNVAQAGDYLAATVPMDRETAVIEAGFFAYNPGQAISYQIGKLQIVRFLSEAKVQLGDEFDLRSFHDYLIINGNVPIELLRWEYLDRKDQITSFFP